MLAAKVEKANCSRIHPQLTVADVLRCWEETTPVFMRHRMACVGCPMACFETLQGAAAVYGLELDAFLEELQASISAARDAAGDDFQIKIRPDFKEETR